MANPAYNSQRVRPARVESARAQGLDPEITAQPRPLSDNVSAQPTDEGGLSVDPDELGSHFLSEAVEEGDLRPRGAADFELSLLSGPETDEALDGPSLELEHSLWEHSVDLTMQSAGRADQLRASAAIAADELEELDRESEESEALRLTEPSVRDLSLFDR